MAEFYCYLLCTRSSGQTNTKISDTQRNQLKPSFCWFVGKGVGGTLQYLCVFHQTMPGEEELWSQKRCRESLITFTASFVRGL